MRTMHRCRILVDGEWCTTSLAIPFRYTRRSIRVSHGDRGVFLPRLDNINAVGIISRRSFHCAGRLILVRHGQSIWNYGTEFGARFTGWANVPLTDLGIEQAHQAGKALRQLNIPIDCAVTSLLQRARKTLQSILLELELLENVKEDQHQSRKQQQLIQNHPHPINHLSQNHSPNSQWNGLHRSFTSSTSTSMSSEDLIASFLYHDPHIMLDHHYACKVPIIASWRLNERSYGALVGMSKAGAEEYYGKHQLDPWRHGWDVRPPPMPEDVVQEWSTSHPHCQMVTIIQTPQQSKQQQSSSAATNESLSTTTATTTTTTTEVATVKVMEKGLPWHGSIPIMPASESLADTCHRVMPLWQWGIAPRLLRGENVLLVAHANTVKAMLRILDPHVITPDGFSRLKIPNTMPLVYHFRPASPYDDDMIPGGLAVVPPGSEVTDDEQERPAVEKQHVLNNNNNKEELRFRLRAQWLG